MEDYTSQLLVLEDEAKKILSWLKEPYSVGQLQERLTQLSAYNARTGEMLAEAEYILTRMKGDALNELLSRDPKMSANQQKIAVESACAEAIRVVRLIERANKSTVHGGEIGITQAYCEKENMSLTRKGY